MLQRFKESQYLLFAITLIATCFFFYQAVSNMLFTPFHDFDEAHRAEKTKRMAENGSYLIPMTGSEFDRLINVSVGFKENPDLRIYYHAERPFLVYLLMILSTATFGASEFGYRLPSFLFGVLTYITLFWVIRRLTVKVNQPAIYVALLSLLTSVDLWLSAQYAQLDTALTFFTFLSFGLMLIFLKEQKIKWMVLSAVSLGLGALSKGQPEVLVTLFVPLLLILRKITFKQFFVFVTIFLIIVLPWVLYLSTKFGLFPTINAISGFAFSSSTAPYYALNAPWVWYIRWWWESLRPGWTLMIVFFLFDLVYRRFDFKKILIAFYIFSALILFSLSTNKIWWYVLPLVPAISLYLYFSISDYLKKNPAQLINLSVVITLASLPIFLKTTTKLTLVYGIILTVVSFAVLRFKPVVNKNLLKITPWLFTLAILLGLIAFSFRFPNIDPLNLSIKPISLKFANLSGKKCLWLLDVPSESVLYYSNAGEVSPLNPDSLQSLRFKNCTNYLLTSTPLDDPKLNNYKIVKTISHIGNLTLLLISKK